VPRLSIRAKLAIMAVMGLASGADRTVQIMGNGPLAMDWMMFWALAAALGLLVGPISWFVGGALFRLRLRFAGVRGVDGREAQGVFALSELVADATLLAWTLMATVSLAAPLELPMSFTVMFSFGWSLFVSYQGVRARFAVSPWKARVWFIIIPGLLYLVLITRPYWS
jgi:hypothetical protein